MEQRKQTEKGPMEKTQAIATHSENTRADKGQTEAPWSEKSQSKISEVPGQADQKAENPSDPPDQLPWHPAFYAATSLEFREDLEELELIREYNLSKEPVRVDLLILKKGRKKKIKNEIGHMLRRYNIVEYKSPGDSLNIDDFYKTIGYACLYKGYGETANQIPAEELTVSLFREKFPRKLFMDLRQSGREITEKYPGIYYITRNLPFPVQIVVTRHLSKENHSSLRILSEHAEKEDVERFLNETESLTSQGEKNNIHALLQVSTAANIALYEEIRRNRIMIDFMDNALVRDAMKRLYKEDFDEVEARGLSQGIIQGEDLAIIRQVLKKTEKGLEPTEIADMLEEEPSRIQEIYDIIMETGTDSSPEEIYQKMQSSVTV